MNAIRFPSVLCPDKFGYEFTNDSMTFWDTSYRHGGVLHCAAGYYETFGDGNVQHSALCACRAEHFTDYCISLVSHLLANPTVEIKDYALQIPCLGAEYVRFLASVRYDSDKRRWFNVVEKKISASEAKQHDKRWVAVPEWADGTITSAYHLHGLTNEQRGSREILPRYGLQELFWDTLYSVAPSGDWEKVCAYRSEMVGDHHSAYRALKGVVEARQALDWARRALECAVHNTHNSAAAAAAAAAKEVAA